MEDVDPPTGDRDTVGAISIGSSSHPRPLQVLHNIFGADRVSNQHLSLLMADFEVTVLDGGSKVLLLSIYNFHWLDFEWNFAKLGKCPHESC